MPELVPTGNGHCLRFEVVWKRSHKVRGEWQSSYESVTFVAWDRTAEQLAERLSPGRVITCTGRQETSRWTDDKGVNQERVTYRLTDFQLHAPPEKRQDATDAQTAPARSVGNHRVPSSGPPPRRPAPSNAGADTRSMPSGDRRVYANTNQRAAAGPSGHVHGDFDQDSGFASFPDR